MISFQQTSSEQGKMFEDACQGALKYTGFGMDGTRETINSIGVEVDFIVTNRHDVSFYITAKGSMRGKRPGCIRTDTLKKALCDAFLLHQEGLTPVLLLTSHVPHGGSGLAMLRSMSRQVLFDVLNPWEHGERLTWLARATEDELQRDLRVPLFDLILRQWKMGNPFPPT